MAEQKATSRNERIGRSMGGFMQTVNGITDSRYLVGILDNDLPTDPLTAGQVKLGIRHITEDKIDQIIERTELEAFVKKLDLEGSRFEATPIGTRLLKDFSKSEYDFNRIYKFT